MSQPRAASGPRGSRRRHLSHGVTLLLVLLAALAVRWVDTSGLRDLRLMAFDSLQRLDPRPYQPLPITILDIDERALGQFGQWPWSRALLARIMDRLSEAERGRRGTRRGVRGSRPDSAGPDGGVVA